MAVLTTKQRNALPQSAFAIPESRSYPIHDEAHAQDALARVSEYGSSEEKTKVRAAVATKYPGMLKASANGKLRKLMRKPSDNDGDE